MKKALKEAIERYQCTGCSKGCDIESGCFENNPMKVAGNGCSNHSPGTMATLIGVFYLGMPKGFCRLGPIPSHQHALCIFERANNLEKAWKTRYDKFNVPVWMHENEHGDTIVKGISPRINAPFLHVFLNTTADEVQDEYFDLQILRITEEEIAEMD